MSFSFLIHTVVRKTGSLFIKSGQALVNMAYRVYSPSQSTSEKNKKEWYRIKGDETLRVNYPLGKDSVVFDVGGYKGEWCAEIAARYCSRIFVFEPVKEFYQQLKSRFAKNEKVKVYHFGLAGKDSEMEIAVMSEASSVYRDRNKVHTALEKEKITLKDINVFISENSIPAIDLMKINIEGGEYDLLESLFASGFVKNIDHIQVQFHDFIPGAEHRMNKIKGRLSETHELTYEYLFVWENWKRKK